MILTKAQEQGLKVAVERWKNNEKFKTSIFQNVGARCCRIIFRHNDLYVLF